MVKRPEGLFPVEHAKAEMHGIGVSAEVTAVSSTELSLAEEEVIEADLETEAEPTSAAEATLQADTPPDTTRDRDLPEDPR
jgi:hypothetical protein